MNVSHTSTTPSQETSPAASAPATALPDAPNAPTPSFSPLYQQIKDLILQSLQAGEWKAGDLIPSELELAARYKVSQGTVRKSIDALAADNLLVRRQGRGTFVATHTERTTQYRFLSLHPDTGNREAEGPATRRMLECKRAKAPADVARALGLTTGEAVIHIKRVLAFDNTPTILEDVWLPAAIFKGLNIEALDSHTGPMYALFEGQFGVRMVRAQEKIKAVGASPATAELLAVPALTPLLQVERLAFTYNDQPMEYRRGQYRTDTHHYRNELF